MDRPGATVLVIRKLAGAGPAIQRRSVMQRNDHDFHLIDLGSQAYAVQQLLKGRPAEEKLAWLAERGELSLAYAADRRFPDTYAFRSRLGFEIAFFLRDDLLVLIGDNTSTNSVKHAGTWGASPCFLSPMT